MSSELDEIFLKQKGKLNVAQPDKPDPLDEALQQSKNVLASELKTTQAEQIIAERRKAIAMAQKETDAIRGTPGAAVKAASVQVSTESTAALLKALIESGTDPEKANEVLGKLDQAVLGKLVVMSGSGMGSEALVPLLLLARQPSTSVTEIVQAAKAVVDMAPKPIQEQPTKLTDLTQALRDLQAMATPPDSGVAAMYEELKAGQDAIKDQMHVQEMKHVEEMSKAREERLMSELGQVRQELASLKGRNLKQEVTEAKEMLVALGFQVSTGGAAAGPNLEKLTETIINSPAVKGMADAAGDAIRARAQTRGYPGAQPQGQQESFACSTCAARGVRTMLPISPAAAEGKEPITCPVCGTVFEKKR